MRVRVRDRNGDWKDATRVVRRLRAEAAATAEGGRNLLRWRRVRLQRGAEVVLREAGNRWEENQRDGNREARRIEDRMDLQRRVGMVRRAGATGQRAGAMGQGDGAMARWDVEDMVDRVLL